VTTSDITLQHHITSVTLLHNVIFQFNNKKPSCCWDSQFYFAYTDILALRHMV